MNLKPHTDSGRGRTASLEVYLGSLITERNAVQKGSWRGDCDVNCDVQVQAVSAKFNIFNSG